MASPATDSSPGAGDRPGPSIPSPHEPPSTSQKQPSQPIPVSHPPIEMSNLPSAPQRISAGTPGNLNDVSIPTTSPITSSFAAAPTSSTSMMEQQNENSRPEPASSSKVASTSTDPLSTSSNTGAAATSQTQIPSSTTTSQPPLITRLDSVAIGPASENPPTPATSNDPGPVLIITLLLTSGARHPYKIDERYLTKRNVNVPGMTENGKKDPFSISVYTLKELILREWREEWEVQPSSPSSIRLIFFGRLLDDKLPLKECRFNAETPNVVHMTVRPQDIVDEEDASKSKALQRERDGGEETAGCRCVIL